MNNNLRNNRFWLNRAVAVVGTVLLSGLQAFGATATGIRRPEPGETVEVLVQYATQPTEEQHQRVTDRNGRIRAAFSHVPVAHYDVTPEALADLEANPDVVSINPNLPVSANLDHAMANANVNPLISRRLTLESSTTSRLSQPTDILAMIMVMARTSRALQPARITSPTSWATIPGGSKVSPRTPV